MSSSSQSLLKDHGYQWEMEKLWITELWILPIDTKRLINPAWLHNHWTFIRLVLQAAVVRSFFFVTENKTFPKYVCKKWDQSIRQISCNLIRGHYQWLVPWSQHGLYDQSVFSWRNRSKLIGKIQRFPILPLTKRPVCIVCLCGSGLSDSFLPTTPKPPILLGLFYLYLY